MRADDHCLDFVLKERQQWVIPVYQRHYAWDIKANKQLPKLWDDIQERAIECINGEKPKPHFVGAIIYSEPEQQPFGVINQRFLVDGQQRITTFSLVLCAIREIAHENDCNNLANSINEYIFNASSNSMHTPDKEKFKLWSASIDRPIYLSIAHGNTDLIKKEFTEFFYKNGKIINNKAPKMLAAYWFLIEKLREFNKENISDETSVEEILNSVLRGFLFGFQIVVVQLGTDDDAQSIFASLNGNAEPLSSFDLIRNDIFHRANKQFEDNDELYETKWKFIETPYWKEEIKQGRLKRARTDHLITHLLIAETAREINTGQVAHEYKKFSDQRNFENAEAEISNLLKYAEAYKSLDQKIENKHMMRIGKFLEIWDMSAFHPLILWLSIQDNNENYITSSLNLIENYIIRRDICGLTNKNYNKVVPGIIRKIQNSNDVLVTLQEYMLSLTGDTSRIPTDSEIQRAFTQQPIYKELSSKKLRYILENIELELRSKFDEEVSINTKDLTIEHIMPEKWSKNWLLTTGDKCIHEDYFESINLGANISPETRALMEEREVKKHSFGNLTMITSSLNPSLGHISWKDKKPRIAKSLLAINRDIANNDVWHEHNIDKRSQELAGSFIKIWN